MCRGSPEFLILGEPCSYRTMVLVLQSLMSGQRLDFTAIFGADEQLKEFDDLLDRLEVL